ncbi:MAG: hypothetical protein Fur0034_12980 [Desulfuromonadia bacterium]
MNRRGVSSGTFLLNLAVGCLSLLFLLSAPSLLWGAGGDLLRTVTDPLAGKQEPFASVMDSGRNVIVAGFRNLSGGVDDDFWVVKYRADGSGIAWRFSHDRAGGSDQAVAVAVDSHDDIIVTGTVWNGLNRDIQTIKINGETGEKIWERSFDGDVHGNDIATSVVVDPLDHIVIGGYSQSVTGDDDILVITYAPDGTKLWSRMYAGAAGGNDHLFSLAVAPGKLFATGQSWGGSQFDAITLAWDLTGSLLWERRFAAPNGSAHGAGGRFIVLSPVGDPFVAGYTSNSLDRDIFVARYGKENGSVVWEHTYNGAFDDDPSSLAVNSSGDLFITGTTWTVAGANDFYTARYAGATGTPLWENGFDSGGANNDVAVPTGMVLDPEGDLYVTGYTVTGSNFDVQTIRYRSDTGVLLWNRSYDGEGGNERPVGIFLTSSSEVTVAGWSQRPSTDLDTILLSYDMGGLNPPTGLSATLQSSTSVSLAWEDNATNESGFRIERRQGDFGSWTEIGGVDANVTTFIDTGLSPDTLYYYRVRSWNETDGFSHYTPAAHILTIYSPSLSPSWTYRYNAPDDLEDTATAIAVGPDGSPVVTGSSLSSAGGFDYLTLKLDRATGAVLWSDRYDSPDNELDKGTCVAVDSVNNPVVSGFSSRYFDPAGRNINSIYTLKYLSTGPPPAWSVQYNGPGGIDDRAVAIATATDASNNVYVLGYGKNAANNEDVYLVKYSSAGARLWSITPFDGGGTDIPSSLVISADGSIFVTGMSETAPGSNTHAILVARYDGGTGALLWSDRYQPAAGGDSRGRGIALDPNGGLYVSGFTTTPSGGRDIVTVKYDGNAAAPTRIWDRLHDGSVHGDDEAVGVRVDPIDGAVIVGGTISTGSGDHDLILLRYASDGAPLWNRTLLRPSADDTMVAMTVDPSGYIYATGTTVAGSTADIIATLYDFEGTLLGVTTYDGPAGKNDEPTAIAVNTQGEGFIAGYSENGDGSSDYVVLKITNPYLLAPAPFTLAPQIDYSQMVVSWGVNSTGTTFRLERSVGIPLSESDWTLMGEYDHSVSTVTDTGLNPGSLYCYRITAYTPSQSSPKPVACKKTRLQPPVLDPVVAVSGAANDLSWNLIPGNTEYRVQRREGSGGWTLIQILPANTTSWRDTGIVPGTIYSYRLRVFNESGGSLVSNAQPVPVLNPITVKSTTTLTLSWLAHPDVTGYRIERSSDGIAWTEVAILPSDALSWTDTGLSPGSTYSYRLRVDTPAGPSGVGIPQSAMTQLTPPTITSISTSSPSTLTLSWSDPNGNEDGYALEYAVCWSMDYDFCKTLLNDETSYQWGSWVRVTLPANSTTYTLTSLQQNYPLRLRVITLKGGGGDSLPSPYGYGMPQMVYFGTLRATPLDIGTVYLEWYSYPPTSGYDVYQDGVKITSYPLNTRTYSHTVTGLSASGHYCFKLGLYNEYSSTFSNEVCVTLSPPPEITSLTPTQTSVTVRWNSVPEAVSYELSSAEGINGIIPSVTSPDNWWQYQIMGYSIPSTTTEYLVTPLNVGYAYKFRLRYKMSDGTYSPYSQEIMTVTIPAVPNVAAPTYDSPTSVTWSWQYIYSYPQFEYQHKIRESSSCSTDDWSSTPITPLTANSVTFSTLTPNTPYCFRVRTVGKVGTPSPWTGSLTAVTILPSPVLSSVTGITASTLTLSWSAVEGNSGYRIERSPNNSSWAEVGTVDQATTTFTDTTVLPDTLYYYRVSAKNVGGVWSAPSNVTSARTLSVIPPVFQLIDQVTTTSARLVWTAVPGNAGYRIERSTDGSTWTEVVITPTDATSHTDGTLSPGTRYLYRVSTRIPSGGLSSPSATLSTVTTPAAPVISGTVISADGVDLSWRLVLGGTKYRIYRSVGMSGPWDLAADHTISYTTDYCGQPLPTIGCPSQAPSMATRGVSGLSAGTEYCFRVRGWNDTGGESADSNTLCLTTSALNGPVITSLTPLGGMKIAIQWEYAPASCSPAPCIDPEGFEIWRGLSSGVWSRIATVGNTTSHLDTIAIQPSRSYSYRVRAVKGGDASSFSPVQSVTTPPFTTGDGVCP